MNYVLNKLTEMRSTNMHKCPLAVAARHDSIVATRKHLHPESAQERHV